MTGLIIIHSQRPFVVILAPSRSIRVVAAPSYLQSETRRATRDSCNITAGLQGQAIMTDDGVLELFSAAKEEEGGGRCNDNNNKS